MKDFLTNRFATIDHYLSTQQLSRIDLKNLFRWSYWTEADTPSQSPHLLLYLLTITVMVIGLVFWRRRLKAAETVAPIYAGPINQLANIIAFIIIVNVSYLFFRAQAIAYLSSRLVVLTGWAIVFGWIGWVIYYLSRTAPLRRREYLERERFFRYIPKKKEKGSENKVTAG